MKLEEHDSIVAVVPRRAEGPGWANFVIWVYIQDGDGTIYRRSMQPDEWKASRELRWLADIGELVASQLISATEKLMDD